LIEVDGWVRVVLPSANVGRVRLVFVLFLDQLRGNFKVLRLISRPRK